MEQANRFHIYQIESPNGLSRRDYLYSLIMEGARARYTTLSPKERNRIEYEWSYISKSDDNIDYLLLVQDIIKRVKAYGGMVGPGRGSAPGSIINYCLGITMVDPLKYGLLFERFYNIGSDFINIATDIDAVTKEKLFDLLSAWYGSEHVQLIADCDKKSIHPSEYLIARENISTDALLPHIEIDGKRVLDVNPLEIVSKCAIDFMGLAELNELQAVHLDWSMVELDNELALRNICLSGFILNSEIMRSVIPRLDYIDIPTLADLYAIDRPGPCVLEEYLSNRRERYKGDGCGAVSDIIAETNGVFIYQEQLIRTLEEVADFTPEEARRIQKYLASKDKQAEEYKTRFVETAVKKGYERFYVEYLWEDMYTHDASFLFIKAHAVAYTILAYWISLVKTYHKAYNSDSKGKQKDTFNKVRYRCVSDDDLNFEETEEVLATEEEQRRLAIYYRAEYWHGQEYAVWAKEHLTPLVKELAKMARRDPQYDWYFLYKLERQKLVCMEAYLSHSRMADENGNYIGKRWLCLCISLLDYILDYKKVTKAQIRQLNIRNVHSFVSNDTLQEFKKAKFAHKKDALCDKMYYGTDIYLRKMERLYYSIRMNKTRYWWE